MIIVVHKTIIVRESEKIYIAGGVRQIKRLLSSFNSVRLMSIQVIENRNALY